MHRLDTSVAAALRKNLCPQKVHSIYLHLLHCCRSVAQSTFDLRVQPWGSAPRRLIYRSVTPFLHLAFLHLASALARFGGVGERKIADDVADDKIDSKTIRALIGNKETFCLAFTGRMASLHLTAACHFLSRKVSDRYCCQHEQQVNCLVRFLDGVRVRVAPSELSTDVTEKDDESGGNICEDKLKYLTELRKNSKGHGGKNEKQLWCK